MKVPANKVLDIDARFLLANERTLLAWIRTSLAVQAGGVALTVVHKNHVYLGIIVLLLGALVALIGYHRFVVAGRAIRTQQLPPEGIGPAVQVILVVAIAIMLSLAQLVILKQIA